MKFLLFFCVFLCAVQIHGQKNTYFFLKNIKKYPTEYQGKILRKRLVIFAEDPGNDLKDTFNYFMSLGYSDDLKVKTEFIIRLSHLVNGNNINYVADGLLKICPFESCLLSNKNNLRFKIMNETSFEVLNRIFSMLKYKNVDPIPEKKNRLREVLLELLEKKKFNLYKQMFRISIHYDMPIIKSRILRSVEALNEVTLNQFHICLAKISSKKYKAAQRCFAKIKSSWGLMGQALSEHYLEKEDEGSINTFYNKKYKKLFLICAQAIFKDQLNEFQLKELMKDNDIDYEVTFLILILNKRHSFLTQKQSLGIKAEYKKIFPKRLLTRFLSKEVPKSYILKSFPSTSIIHIALQYIKN